MKRFGPPLVSNRPTPNERRNITFINEVARDENGAPHIISMRPVFTAARQTYAELDVMNAMADELSANIARHIQSYRPTWTFEEAIQRVSGYMRVTNIRNESVRMFDLDVFELVANDIHNAIVQMQQSNETVSVFDLEIAFIIVPASFIVGAAKGVAKPSWLKTKSFLCTWSSFKYGDHEIGCAAFALNFGRNKNLYRHGISHRVRKDAYLLQVQMGWGTETTISQFQKFVDTYPKYKVIVVNSASTIGHYTFYNEGWTEKIYILYDAVQQHFALITSALVAITHKHGGGYCWCDTCDVAYLRASGHPACGVQKPTREKPNVPCIRCGLLGKHSCEMFQCKTCMLHISKKDSIHRCLVVKDARDPDRCMFQGMPDAPPNSPGLWVYDLEARVQLVDTTIDYVQSFSTTDNKYDADMITVYERKIEQQVGNMVVFKQVFSAEPVIVYFGEDCIDRFIIHMMQVNDGNNICLAHNASGYDTRLVFKQATKFVQKDKISVIMQGGKFY